MRCCSLLASGMLLLLWSQLADCSRLLQTTTIPDGYVQVDAIFESRLFANGNVALVTLDDAVTTTLQALAADGPVVVVEKSESAVLGRLDCCFCCLLCRCECAVRVKKRRNLTWGAFQSCFKHNWCRESALTISYSLTFFTSLVNAFFVVGLTLNKQERAIRPITPK